MCRATRTEARRERECRRLPLSLSVRREMLCGRLVGLAFSVDEGEDEGRALLRQEEDDARGEIERSNRAATQVMGWAGEGLRQAHDMRGWSLTHLRCG